MGRELWLFTVRYPQGTTEPFLENELPVLAKRFDRVRIFPLLRDTGSRPVPPGVEVTHLLDDPYRPAGPIDLLRHWRVWRSAWRSISGSSPSPEVLGRHRREVFSRLRQALRRMLVVRAALAKEYDPERVTIYSYWTADQATVLGLWKLADPHIRFCSRMHGFDLFIQRSPDNWPPFRTFQLAQVERVFLASQAGLDHLVANYPGERNKFMLSRLGTMDHGAGPWSPANELRIVSCSNLIPLKRVHLIAEALGQVTTPVRWTHVGDGPERMRIEQLIGQLPPHITVTLMGALPNIELLAWYRRNPVDLFVHVSETEGGVPVAIQEAASFGIPLLAADSGGVREIVNEHTGVLLRHDPAVEEITQAIEHHASSPRYTTRFREGVRSHWQAHFLAQDNFGRFCDQLLAGDVRA